MLSLPGLHLRVQDDHGVCVYWAKHIDDRSMTIENVRTGEVRDVSFRKAGAVAYELTVMTSRLARVLLRLHQEGGSTQQGSSTSPTG